MTAAPHSSEPLSRQELAAWRGTLEVHARVTQALDAQMRAEHGLPLSSYEVLLFLDDAPGQRMRMSELAESILLSRSGLTRLVDRLERDGLLCRQTCSQDARGSFAKLTPAGAEKLAAARATHLAGVRALFLAHLDEDEKDLLGELWARIVPGAHARGPASTGG